MLHFFFIFAASITQAFAVNAIRDIQARASSILLAVVFSYAVSTILGFIYMNINGVPPDWASSIPYGAFTGFFYIASLITMIFSMGQRGLAVTIALANMSMIMPVLIAIFAGDRPTMLQYTGIVVALIAIPILSLSTATGTAIRHKPAIWLAVLLFFVRGLGATGNLVAESRLDENLIPAYLMMLFGWCFIFGLIAMIIIRRKSSKLDYRLGLNFGVLNYLAAAALLIGLTKIPGSLFFSSYNVLGLALTAVLAIILWKERVQRWGWIGFVLAMLATLLLNVK